MSKLYVDAYGRSSMPSTIAPLLALIVLLVCIPNTIEVATAMQSNTILIHGDRIEWHYASEAVHNAKPLSLTILLIPKKGVMELHYNSSTGPIVRAMLRYHLQSRNKVIEIDILSNVLSRKQKSNITVSESSASKIIIANRSIEVLLYSYEIEITGLKSFSTTPIERDISKELLAQAHKLGYGYITNLFGIFKRAFSAYGSKYSYDVFDVDIDTRSYLLSLSPRLRTLCKFINESSLYLNVSTMLALYTSPAVHTTAAYNPTETSLDIERVLCLLPLVSALNEIVMKASALPSIPRDPALSPAKLTTYRFITENVAIVTALYRELKRFLNTTDYVLFYSIHIQNSQLVIHCSITHKLGNAKNNVTEIFSIVQSYVAELPLLSVYREILSTAMPHNAYIRCEGISRSDYRNQLSTMVLSSNSPPRSLRLIVAATLTLVALQTIAILYYIIKAIKKR